MHNELTLSLSSLYGFLFVLTRVAGVFVFVPLPGLKNGPEPARVILSLAITMALFPRWPAVEPAGLGSLVGWMLSEAALGITIGLVAALVTETFLMGAQILSLQAGYSYASTIDPTSNAESGVLLILANLISGLLFFALGLDRPILLAIASSLDLHPPGTFLVTRPLAEHVIRLGAVIFGTGLRLILPLVALLLMVDVALALLGRLNMQLQLVLLAFPVKILLTLAVLAWTLVLYPRVFVQTANQTVFGLRGLFGP